MRLREVRADRRLREKISLEEKQVRHVRFGCLLDSCGDVRQAVGNTNRERALDLRENSGDFQCPWSLRELSPRPSSEALQLSEVDYKLRRFF